VAWTYDFPEICNRHCLELSKEIPNSYAFCCLLSDRDYAQQARELMTQGFRGIKLIRGGKPSLYRGYGKLFDDEIYEDFFALAGMNQLAFVLMNAKIQRELRNSANRIANCETNNITKAINASQSQIAILRELDAKGLMSQLPDELEKTARLRMEHDDLSLSQLAALMTPRVSKPGLSHRLKRITEIATSLLERSNKKH
jgi:DNA-binding transcriptional regulator WhiA